MIAFAEVSEAPLSSSLNLTLKQGCQCPRFYGWFLECHGFGHSVALIIPSGLYLIYLASQVNKSFAKLYTDRSHVQIWCYGFLWLVGPFNLAWFSFQAWQCTPGKEIAWNVLSLFTTSAMLFMELSFLAFVMQGNYMSGLGALMWTFKVSGLIMGLDILLKAVYLVGLGIPLSVDNNEHTHLFWIVHKLLLAAIYGSILFLYHFKRRERFRGGFPISAARPEFYSYFFCMFCLNVLPLFVRGLTGSGATLISWLYDYLAVCCHANCLFYLYRVTSREDSLVEKDMRLIRSTIRR